MIAQPEEPVLKRPLETTFWMRFSQFMKGFFLYNTIYWRRASDDLNIRRMSREERANLRPVRNLDIIRPRERARPQGSRSVLSMPGEYSEPLPPQPAEQVSMPASHAPTSQMPASAEGDDTVVEIHRRKKRRSSRHSKVMPKRYYDSSGNGGGILGWLFKK